LCIGVLLLLPLRFKLGGGQVAQGRMNPLMGIDGVDEMAQLAPSIGKVFILSERNFVLLNGADQPFSIAILRLD
jgi:hypothetical protein